jgi:hypothetical protein
MAEIRWSALKNDRLKKTRGISFEEILKTEFVLIMDNTKRENQKIMLFFHKKYIWAVPFVEDENGIFLKTIFQSTKYTKLYKEGNLYEKD